MKLSGKHVPIEELKHVVFYIPSHKTTLRDYIAAFVDEFCHVNWVKMITELEEAEIGRNTDTSVYLLDEVYDTNTIERNINRGRIYAVLIVIDQLSFSFSLFSRPDVEVIYFRKIYRSPEQIARCCSKIKRLLDQENVDSNCCTSDKSYIRCLPWEMSNSNRPPLSENGSIVVKSYASLDDIDMSELISEDETSKLVVTWDVEKEKVETLIRLITAHENFPANRLKTENGFKIIRAGFEKFDPKVLTALNCRIEHLETLEKKNETRKGSILLWLQSNCSNF